MKNKIIFLAALTLTAVFLFYRVDSIVAMAVEQNMESAAGSETEYTGEADVEPAEEPAEPEEPQEPVIEPEPEGPEEPIVEPEPGGPEEPIVEPETEGPEEPIVEPEPEEPEEPVVEPKPEEPEESIIEPEPELMMQFLAEPQPEEMEMFTAGAEPEQIEAFYAGSEAETVSTGEALMDWLESHKNTGGTVRLTDHVFLDGADTLCLNGADLFVDTGQYTITVTGEITFLSNGQLAFSGEPEGQGVFYVAEKGLLSLYGISVKSNHCALWQEEGAGLEVTDCSVSGDIQYADTPFVMYYNDNLCAVVEKGQTLNDALPTQIYCMVIKQGQMFSNEPVALSWNLEGTERQQEERRRFEVQGFFSGAESAEPVRCAVVYNDYPLTFTDVSASISGGSYIFQGGFTVPEESLPFTVMVEYSFDGENWTVCGEPKATNTNPGFYVDIPLIAEQCSAEASSKIYIRLQWNDNGTRYFSNVLCYAADNVEQADDIGGSRGGGTSIVNPPDVPQQSIESPAGDGPSENGSEKDSQTTGQTKGAEIQTTQETARAVNIESQATQEGAQAAGSAAQNTQEAVQAAGTEYQATQEAVQPAGTESSDTEGTVQAAGTESSDTEETVQAAGTELSDTEGTVQAAGAEPQELQDIGEALLVTTEQSLYAEAKPENKVNLKSGDAKAPEKNGGIVRILVAAGFVLLSGIAGTAGFCVHFRSGTNR